VSTPATFPKTAPDVVSAPGLFRKVDPEALFFAFYYQPDTYQQYLAAQVRGGRGVGQGGGVLRAGGASG
jgi:CCR4-NOT transcriptional regulation complex NOT5 subunit